MSAAGYRRAMLERKAAKAGLSIEEFVRRSESEAERQRQVTALIASRTLWFAAIARKALAHGRSWAVVS